MSFVAGAVLVQALSVSVTTGGTATADKAAAGPTLNSVELAIVKHTNAIRKQHGRQPLAVDPRLLKSARRHTQWMTRYRTMQHTRAAVAENIAMGQRSAAEVLRSWMNSSGHRANILNPGHRRIGVSAYRTPDGTIFWCQQFLR